MKVLVAGASGLIGRALVRRLRSDGHEVFKLVRRAIAGTDEIEWNPTGRTIDLERIEGIDAVVNLAGESIVGRRWTVAQRERILHSRTNATFTLVTALAKLARKPAVFLSASAVGFYGERGDEELSENSAIGQGFLPGVCLAWEAHALGAARAEIRTVILRFGIVLAREGGALAKMLPAFQLGLGGRLGTGRQWLSWVSIDDAVGAICHALSDSRCLGPLNIVAPSPVRNVEFVAVLGRVLHRPVVLPVPAWALRLAFGELADETLLASTRAEPARLLEAGYTFRQPELEAALRQVLGK